MKLVIIPWRMLSYFFLIPLFLLVSIILIVINAFSAFVFDRRIGPINLGTFSATLTFRCCGVSEYSLPLSSSITDLLSASQSSSLSFGWSKSPFQWSQFSVSEMLSGERSSSLSAGWRSIRLIRRTFNTSVRPPGRFLAEKAGGPDDLSDNLNATTPSCRKFDQDALTISAVYPTAVSLFFEREIPSV